MYIVEVREIDMLASQVTSTKTIIEEEQEQLIVRINGTLPDISTLGVKEKTERAEEVKLRGTSTNTSCSLYGRIKPDQQIFHMLVDVGQGVVKSVEKGASELAKSSLPPSSSFIPNALLITHSHDDHIKELPILVDKVNEEAVDKEPRGKNYLKIFCTTECRDQVIKKFPQLSGKINYNNRISFNTVQPNETFEVGPFSVTPILAYHGNNSPPGSVIYIVKLLDKKIVIGWDFLSLPNANQNLFWNPDLLILGTQSYNSHPDDTGMICITDTYDLVRRWNAKESYLVHYSGLPDFNEGSNQWFRGPVKAMTTDKLQSVIDAHLQVTGDNGKFTITVAKEGMVWSGKEGQNYDENTPIGKVLEIESLQKYILKIENDDIDDKLKLIIEDSINRFNLEFVRPIKDGNSNDDDYYNNNTINAQGVKGMMAKGPQLRFEIVPSQPQPQGQKDSFSIIKIRVYRGKKDVFKDDVYVSDMDAQRLKRFIKENFIAASPQ